MTSVLTDLLFALRESKCSITLTILFVAVIRLRTRGIICFFCPGKTSELIMLNYLLIFIIVS